jgi:Bacterial Ig-like domain (group 3)
MQSASATSATLKVAAGSAPTASVLPKITGTAKVGLTLATTTGTWSGSGWTFSYQWLRGTTAIAGATAATYKLKTIDAGAKVAVRVTATKPGYGKGVATSASRTVAKLASTIRGYIVRTTITTKANASVVAVVKVAGILSPTGKVRVYYGSRSIIKTLGAKGKVTVTLPKLAKGRYTIKVRYLGSTKALPSTIVTIGRLKVV